MRKPRNFDAELKALRGKAQQLKARKVQQLGELVIACGADALPAERLAGALVLAVETNDAAAKEAQRAKGEAFFRGPARAHARRADGDREGSPAHGNSSQPASARPGSQ